MSETQDLPITVTTNEPLVRKVSDAQLAALQKARKQKETNRLNQNAAIELVPSLCNRMEAIEQLLTTKKRKRTETPQEMSLSSPPQEKKVKVMDYVTQGIYLGTLAALTYLSLRMKGYLTKEEKPTTIFDNIVNSIK